MKTEVGNSSSSPSVTRGVSRERCRPESKTAATAAATKRARGEEPYSGFRILYAGPDEALEQRRGLDGPGLELGMALHAEAPGMVGPFDRLDEAAVRRHAR